MYTPTTSALPTHPQDIAEAQTEIPFVGWRWLCRAAGAAALLSAIFIPIQIIVFIAWPPPLDGTVVNWFRLFQANRLIGLIDLDLLLVADNVLLIPILLVLYIALRRASQSLMAIANVFGLIGIILFITSNPAIAMLSLSDHHAAATTEAQRAAFLAAGQALLAGWQGTAFHVGYLLSSIAGIAIPVVMLQGTSFSKATAVLGILANAIGLGLYVPAIGIYLALFSVVFLEAWYVLLGRRLLQLGQSGAQDATT